MAEPTGFTLDSIGYGAQPQANAVSPQAPLQTQPEQTPSGIAPETFGLQPRQSTSTGEDIAKSAQAGAIMGAVDPLAIVNAIPYYAQQPLPEAQLNKMYENLSPDEILDLQEGRYSLMPIPPENYLQMMLAAGGAYPISAPAINSGKEFTLIPTMQGTYQEAERNLPSSAYQSETKAGDIIGTAMRAGVGTVTSGGGPKGFVPGSLAGGAGRAVGIGTESITGSPTVGVGAELGTNIITDFLTRKIGGIAYDISAPNNAAFEKIAQGIAVKINSDPQKKAALLNAIRSGQDVRVNDLLEGFLDDKTKAWMAKNLPGDYASNIIFLQDDLIARSAPLQDNLDRQFAQIFGADLTDNGWQKALEAEQAAETSRLYGQVRSNPAANSITSPALLNQINRGGIIQKAATEVSTMAKRGELGPDVVPLDFRVGQNGKIVVRGGAAAPNFDYWDRVKRNLDGKANEFYRAGNTEQGDVYNNAAKSVRDAVSEVIGEYPEARAAAQKAIQTPASLEGGYNFGQKLANGRANQIKFDEFMDTFNQANPEQKLRLQQGLGRSLLQLGSEGDFKKISRLMSSRVSRQNLEKILGPEKFAQVYGAMAQKSAMQTTTKLLAAINNDRTRAAASKNPVIRDLAISLTSGGGAAGLTAALSSTPSLLTSIASGALVGSAFMAKAGLDARQRSIAREVMRLATSQDPADAIKLGKVLQSDMAAVTALGRLTSYAEDALRSGLLASAREQDKQQKRSAQMAPETQFVTPDVIPGFNDGRASGGRVQRKSGGRVAPNKISAEIARTRAMLSEKTASILSVPDDAIISALQIAKKS